MWMLFVVPAWLPRSASFKNELLRRHFAGNCAGERGPTWHPSATLVWKGASRHERYNAQEAGHVQKLKVCRIRLAHTGRPHL